MVFFDYLFVYVWTDYHVAFGDYVGVFYSKFHVIPTGPGTIFGSGKASLRI